MSQAKEAALQEASSRESSLTEQLAGITERSAQLGELPVLKNALETAKSDMAALKKEHEVEREKVCVYAVCTTNNSAHT